MYNLYLYAIHNKKLDLYEDFVLYNNGNDFINDLIGLREDFEYAQKRKRFFALPNYLVHPAEYDVFKICNIDERNFSNPTNSCHVYKGSVDELLNRNYLDREDVKDE